MAGHKICSPLNIFFSCSRKHGQFLTSKTGTEGTTLQYRKTRVSISSAGDIYEFSCSQISLDVRERKGKQLYNKQQINGFQYVVLKYFVNAVV